MFDLLEHKILIDCCPLRVALLRFYKIDDWWTGIFFHLYKHQTSTMGAFSPGIPYENFLSGKVQ